LNIKNKVVKTLDKSFDLKLNAIKICEIKIFKIIFFKF